MAFDFVGKSHLDEAGKLIIYWRLFFLTPLEIHVEEGIFGQLFSAVWLLLQLINQMFTCKTCSLTKFQSCLLLNCQFLTWSATFALRTGLWVDFRKFALFGDRLQYLFVDILETLVEIQLISIICVLQEILQMAFPQFSLQGIETVLQYSFLTHQSYKGISKIAEYKLDVIVENRKITNIGLVRLIQVLLQLIQRVKHTIVSLHQIIWELVPSFEGNCLDLQMCLIAID